MNDSSKLDALLVRHVGDIEAALHHISAITTKRLFRELAEVVEDELDEKDWFSTLVAEDNDLWFAPRTWLTAKTNPQQADAWFALDELVQDGGEADETWIAELLAVGPQGAKTALIFYQDPFGRAAWKKLLKQNGPMIAMLQEAGVSYDASSASLYIPVTLQGETLATAFEQEEFEAAFLPFREAVRTAVAARPLIDELLTKARATAA
jgi:hypothetical protein